MTINFTDVPEKREKALESQTFALNRVLSNKTLVSTFKEHHIHIESFLESFNKAFYENKYEELLTLWAKNYWRNNQTQKELNWFIVISELLKLAKIDLSPQFLFEEASRLNLFPIHIDLFNQVQQTKSQALNILKIKNQ